MSEHRSPFHELTFPPPRQRYEPVRLPEPPPSEDEGARKPRSPLVNFALFVATVVSVFMAGAAYVGIQPSSLRELSHDIHRGWPFAVPLLGILLCHEFGHYIAARLHKVDASLPYFLPLPVLSPFGTLGAVIAMRGRIRSRNALLDIGASGPLAGLVVAIPVLALGLFLSPVKPLGHGPYEQEGQSLLYVALKRIIVGEIPDGFDVYLHPTAFAGWAGLLVTMLNLLPWGQLDGGHVAYALFGRDQDRYATYFRKGLLALFILNVARFIAPILTGKSSMSLGMAISNSSFWLVWFVVLGLIARFSGGAAHPPTEAGELSPWRRRIAIFTLALFILLFMPSPITVY